MQKTPAARLRYLWSLFALLIPTVVYAQAMVQVPAGTLILNSPRFFAALVGGLILALAFQLVLTNLSVAAGLSILGPVNANKPSSRGQGKEESGGVQKTLRTISSSFGIWTLITASISLFFASWLASRLGLAASAMMGAILGLTIWGLFYIISMTLEVGAVSSLVGSLARFASNGLKSAYAAAASIFQRSPEAQAVDTAKQITEAVRGEIFGGMSGADIRGQLQQYINQLKPSPQLPEQIAHGLAQVLDETEIKMVTSPDSHQSFVDFLQKQGKMTKEHAQAVAGGLQKAAGVVKEEAGAQKGVAEKAADAAVRMAGVPKGEAEEYRRKVEDYLRSTGKPQLNPEGIKHDIEELVRSPRAGFEAIKSRVASIDKSTVTALLAQRKDMSPDEAKRVVDRVDQVLREITGRTQQATGEAQGKAQAAMGGAQGKIQATMGGVQDKVKHYLDSLGRPELKYEGIKGDLQKLFHDPKAGAEALINRMKSIDRNTIKAVLASRKDISEDDAEHIINRVESTRDDMVQRAERMRDEVVRRVEAARDEVMEQAEETRKTASVAAWWLFATSVVSGIAAVLGGIAGSIRI